MRSHTCVVCGRASTSGAPKGATLQGLHNRLGDLALARRDAGQDHRCDICANGCEGENTRGGGQARDGGGAHRQVPSLASA